MAGGVGRSRSDFNDQVLVQHPLQVPLQAAAVDGRAECIEILDGQLAVLNEVAECLSLALIQGVPFHQHVAADDLLAAFAQLDHLGFQAGDEVIEPAGQVHALQRTSACLDLVIDQFFQQFQSQVPLGKSLHLHKEFIRHERDIAGDNVGGKRKVVEFFRIFRHHLPPPGFVSPTEATAKNSADARHFLRLSGK
jgi:hypothetical protein